MAVAALCDLPTYRESEVAPAVLPIERSVTRDAIERDASFVGRYINSIRNGGSKGAPIASLALSGYFALFIWESQKWLHLSAQGAASLLNVDIRKIIERSRNSLKLFEDDQRRIPGQLKYFREEILAEHRDFYYGRFGGFVPPEATDLGIYRYADSIICTTHSASFGLGIPAARLFGESTFIRDLAEDYGRYFTLWGANVVESESFIHQVDDALVGNEEDVRSCEFYNRTFNEPGPEELNGFLSILQGAMNFSNDVISLDCQAESFYTVFKMRFLTLYHVIWSVRALIGSKLLPISPESRSFILKIISTPMAKAILQDSNVIGLRQSLMHYRPEARFVAHINTAAPVYGLLQMAFPGRSSLESVEEIYGCAADTATLLNNWAERRMAG